MLRVALQKLSINTTINSTKRTDRNDTFDASVRDFEIWLKVVVARLDVVKVIIQHSHTARPATGTVSVKDRKYVDRTTDETEVLFYTATDAHATVAGVLSDDHLVWVTLDSQVLGLTESVLHQQWLALCTATHTHTHLGRSTTATKNKRPSTVRLENAYWRPLFQRAIETRKLGQTDLVLGVRSWFISGSERARLQVPAFSGWDLFHPN